MKDQGTRITKALLKLSPDVTAADRTYCSKKLNISKVTISNCLNGRVTNNDIALAMIEIFKTRIEARDAKLKTLCQNS